MKVPYWPASLAAYVAKHDVAVQPMSVFAGKRIRVLSGAVDKLVPWTASREFVEALDVGSHGVKEVTVYEGIGHQVTPDMVRDAAKFIGEWVESVSAKL